MKMFSFLKRNRRVVNSNGEILCTKCGEFRSPEEYYDNRSECMYCTKNKSTNNLAQRVRDAKRAQEERVGFLTSKDDFCVADLLDMIAEQNNACPCGEEFHSIRDFEISHQESAKHQGSCTRKNLVLLCHECNKRGKEGAEDHYYAFANTTVNCGNHRMDVDW